MRKQLKPWVLLSVLLCLLSCNNTSKEQQIVDAAIQQHGGERFEDSHIAFDFRDKHYTYTRRGDGFTYTRSFEDSTGKVLDVLNNEGFTRSVNGRVVRLPAEREKAFSNSVNSVIYFALLPYRLNDPAVNKAYVGQTEIEGKPYHLIRVNFDEEGGGEDFEDEFLYWINAQTNTVDYLAYSYHTDGGGLRFRKAINPRQLGSIYFQDYINYKPASDQVPLDSLEALYKRGALEEVSVIALENIEVKPAAELK